MAERSTLIGALTAEVLGRSCAQVAAWRRNGMPRLELTVNISGRELADPGLTVRVEAALEASGLPPEALWLEITETALSEQTDRATERLRQLCDLGVRISLDDFGTGFATLAQLHQFPGQALKVDRMFVDGLVAGERGATAIVRSVLALGRELGLTVVAEGVETEAQWAALKGMGCVLFQGYLFARPCFPDPTPPWVEEHVGSEAIGSVAQG
jgi:EAL domain-containing protein (putative c-di-GMP-specific phosphodiesterase class I)